MGKVIFVHERVSISYRFHPLFLTRNDKPATLKRARRMEKGGGGGSSPAASGAHSDAAGFECVRCGMKFPTLIDLTRHAPGCVNAKRCAACDQILPPGESRDDHRKVCGKYATVATKLSTAEAYGDSSLPQQQQQQQQPRITCHYCGEQCLGETGLRDHLRRCFRCLSCGLSATSQSELDRHLEICGMPSGLREEEEAAAAVAR